MGNGVGGEKSLLDRRKRGRVEFGGVDRID